MLSESPKTMDITGFAKKFCIAIRTNEKVPTFELPLYGVKGWDYSFIISVYYTPFQIEAEFSCSVFDAAVLRYKNEYTLP